MAKSQKPIEVPKPKVISAEDAEKKIPERNRTSKYDEILKTISEIKPGQAIELPCADADAAKKLSINLTNAINDREIKAPAGHRFWRNIGVNGQLIITLRASSKKKRGN